MKQFLIILVGIMAAATMRADGGDAATNEALMTILGNYQAWNSAEFDGKAKIDSAPVSPRVKLYMERGKLIQISVRAPFVGEVFRADVDTDSVLVVNKLAKTYAREPVQRLLEFYPYFIGDVQSLLLGRIIILGAGELDLHNASMVKFESKGKGAGWTVIPPESEGLAALSYCYSVTSGGRTSMLSVQIPSQKIEGTLEYTYGIGLGIGVRVIGKGKPVNAVLDFNSVKWGGSPFDPFVPGAAYTRVPITKIFK